MQARNKLNNVIPKMYAIFIYYFLSDCSNSYDCKSQLGQETTYPRFDHAEMRYMSASTIDSFKSLYIICSIISLYTHYNKSTLHMQSNINIFILPKDVTVVRSISVIFSPLVWYSFQLYNWSFRLEQVSHSTCRDSLLVLPTTGLQFLVQLWNIISLMRD